MKEKWWRSDDLLYVAALFSIPFQIFVWWYLG